MSKCELLCRPARQTEDLGTTATWLFQLSGRRFNRANGSDAASSPSSPEKKTTQGTILVVEDEDAIRLPLVDLLSDEGYPVLGAANGLEALEIIEQTQPALILLDMRMPIMDGWTFAHELQRRDLRVPIVVMTAAENAERWANEIHASGTLAKPFDLMELLTTVARFLCLPS